MCVSSAAVEYLSNRSLTHSNVHLQGDTALHWAGRRRHGSVLLQIALEIERIRPGSSTSMWFVKVVDCDQLWTATPKLSRSHDIVVVCVKNLQGKTVIDLISSSEFLVPLLQKRLGSAFTVTAPAQRRRSRFPIKVWLSPQIVVKIVTQLRSTTDSDC
jgi:hypothetical protein